MSHDDKEKLAGDVVPTLARTDGDEFDDNYVLTPEEDKALKRKADLHLLPILCLGYFLQFLDKTSMSYAAVMGFRPDNKLSLSDYSWLGSIFYLGYLVGEYPMCVLLQKLPIAKVTAANMIIWGAILAMMAVAHNFAGLMVVRFLLGFFESSITPSLALFTGQWYRLREQGTRTGLWFSMNGLGYIVGGAMGWGLLKATNEHKLAIAGWRIIFIACGIATVAAGLLVLFFIPDTPEKAWFLNERERRLVKIRTRENQQPSNTAWEWPQFWEALRDPLTWLYSLVAILACIPNGVTTNFFTIILSTLNFSTADTLLLGMINSWLGINYILYPWLGDKFKNRNLMTLFPCAQSITGFALVWALPKHMQAGRLAGFYLIIPYIVCLPITLSLITSNVAGKTKKSTVNALYLIFYCVGNLIGPQTFRAQDAPNYTPCYVTCIVCVALVGVTQVAIYLVYRRENARRDKLEEAQGVHLLKDLEGLTDRTNPHFRYTY
ncbi:hypothetical protein VHUM_02347 [Vanrija humicola]|uniref:Major facilitator superfamily (MFS) profile domain-containing protein n=1 Tax=Vanrija humicola TaxID=5417 RepID=A0A7D8ZAG5_VANHU|nr:hypothetical protein VHUM_02347 [Vanrija humicola]